MLRTLVTRFPNVGTVVQWNLRFPRGPAHNPHTVLSGQLPAGLTVSTPGGVLDCAKNGLDDDRWKVTVMTADSPPAKLRLALEQQRDCGRPFKTAWLIAVNAALQDQDGLAPVWRRIFNEQRQVWATSYSRAPWPANRRRGLEGDVLDMEPEPAARSAMTLVA